MKAIISSIFCLILLTKSASCQSQDSKIINGIVHTIENALPTSAEIINAPIQLLVGYPYELIITAVDVLCSLWLKVRIPKPIKEPTDADVEMQFHTTCESFYYKLSDVDQLVENPKFERNKKVVVLTLGYMTNPNKTSLISDMAKAYNCRGDVNFLAYDTFSTLDTLYMWSSYDTAHTGALLAKFLARLLDFVPIENIHLIGHSLGAHAMSYASKYLLSQTAKRIVHITALDPAKPCFNSAKGLPGISRGDAEFIDVIHSNPGVLGKREAVGDVDFYTNGFSPIVTGCHGIICAHFRCFDFYVESVYPGNEENFLATHCNSLPSLRRGRCTGEQYAMGYAVNKSLRGNYFLEVNSFSPYGKSGSKEREAANKNCGACGK